MYGGAQRDLQTDMFLLGDIGDYKAIDDMLPIGVASLVGLDIGLLLTRTAGLGGLSANAYFDSFGLEGVLAMITLILLEFQLGRWMYTGYYATSAKPWSPFVFVCILFAVQVLHDLTVYYGALKTIPAGKNEMVDALKRYAAENGSRALTGHLSLLVVISVVAMVLKESSAVFVGLVLGIGLYSMCLLVTTAGPKPPPPPPPPPKKDPFEQRPMALR
jgi:hypothetical protein